MRIHIASLVFLLAVVFSLVTNVAPAQPTQGQLVLSSYSANPGVWYGFVGSKFHMIKNLNSSYMLNCAKTGLFNTGVVCAEGLNNRPLA